MTTQIPQGYKQTSIGIIPVDWKIKEVGQAYKICNNLRFPISEDLRKDMRGIYPYYGPTKIQDYINEFRVEGKYALIGEDGDHFLKWNELPMTLLVEGKFNVNNHAHLIQGDAQNKTEWFFYYFNHRPLTKYLTRQGAGRYKLTKETLSKIPIPLPSLLEQQKITDVFYTWDTAIETCQKTIDQLKQRNKGLGQELLSGKKRLEGFEDKEWNFVKFKEFYAPNKKPSGNAKFELLSVTKNGIVSQEKYFNKSIASEDTSKYLIVKKGDFVVSGLNFWMGSYDVLSDFEIGMVSPAYKVLKLNEKYSKSFFKHLVGSRQMKNAMISSSVVGASIVRRNFDLEVLYEYAFKIPEIDEQEAIGNVLDAAQEELKIYEGKLHNLQQQKKGLMQQLLTGKVRTVNL